MLFYYLHMVAAHFSVRLILPKFYYELGFFVNLQIQSSLSAIITWQYLLKRFELNLSSQKSRKYLMH